VAGLAQPALNKNAHIVRILLCRQEGEITNLKLADYGLRKMVRPERFELPTLWFVARCSIQLSYGRITETISGDFDYSGNSRLDEDEGGGGQTIRHTVNTLCPALSIFFLALSMNFRHHSCLRARQRKSFSPLAIPTRIADARALYFQVVEIGKSGATIIGRRSGAQRGALEDKLRPEVFLDAPCISL
jgi:hypothetical protein